MTVSIEPLDVKFKIQESAFQLGVLSLHHKSFNDIHLYQIKFKCSMSVPKCIPCPQLILCQIALFATWIHLLACSRRYSDCTLSMTHQTYNCFQCDLFISYSLRKITCFQIWNNPDVFI
jgi:hypothetical protein